MNQLDSTIITKANDLLKSSTPELGVELLQQHLPPHHHYLAIAYNALAAKQYEKQEWSAAKLSLEHAKIIWQESRPHSVELAACENNLGRVYENIGENQKAIEAHLHAYEIRKQILGNNHNDTGDSLMALGAAYLMDGKGEEAEKFLQQAAVLFAENKGKESPEYQACQANLTIAQSIQ